MPHESKRVVPNMKSFRKILCLSLCLLAACLLALPCAQADGAWGQYASLKMKIATRTGPSTDYTEPGTFFPDTWRNQQVRVLTRGQTNGTWWLQIEFENKGSRYRAYTGLKRVNVDISTVPDEYPMGTAYIAGDMYPIGFYGPGTDYARIPQDIPPALSGTVMDAENGFVLFDFYDPNLGQQRRAWVDYETLFITWNDGSTSAYYVYPEEDPHVSWTDYSSSAYPNATRVPNSTYTMATPETRAQFAPGQMFYKTDNPNTWLEMLDYGQQGNLTYVNLYLDGTVRYDGLSIYMTGLNDGVFTTEDGSYGDVHFATGQIDFNIYLPKYNASCEMTMR